LLGPAVLPPAHIETCFFWTSHDRFAATIFMQFFFVSHNTCVFSSRYGFFYVRPTAIAFETSARGIQERDSHRRLSMSGERRRLAVTFPVKFSMQGQSQWSAAFLRDGFCTITAQLHLWNRRVAIFVSA
jgi:hypothetical protein